MANTHPSVETIERFAMNQLPEAELAPFEEHLLLCPKCQDRVAEADQFIAAAKAAATRLESETPGWGQFVPKHPKPVWAAAAAALIVLFYLALPHSSAPPQLLALTTMRGAGDNAVAKAGAPIQLTLDGTGLPARQKYDVNVVDASGTLVATRQAQHQKGTTIAISCDPLRPGQYWVRVVADGAVLREYSLPVR